MTVKSNLQVFYPSIPETTLDMVIEQCTEDFKEFTNLAVLPANTDALLIQMCKETINQIGSEGVSGESAAGTSLSYIEGYSKRVTSRLNQYKHIRTV